MAENTKDLLERALDGNDQAAWDELIKQSYNVVKGVLGNLNLRDMDVEDAARSSRSLVFSATAPAYIPTCEKNATNGAHSMLVARRREKTYRSNVSLKVEVRWLELEDVLMNGNDLVTIACQDSGDLRVRVPSSS